MLTFYMNDHVFLVNNAFRECLQLDNLNGSFNFGLLIGSYVVQVFVCETEFSYLLLSKSVLLLRKDGEDDMLILLQVSSESSCL